MADWLTVRRVIGRLALCEDRIDIIRNGYKTRQRVVARNPTTSTKASNVIDTEVTRLLEKGVMCEVGRVQEKYVSSYFAIPKSRKVLTNGGQS